MLHAETGSLPAGARHAVVLGTVIGADAASGDRRVGARRGDDRATLSPQQEQAARIHEKLRREAGPVVCRLLDEWDVLDIVLNPDGRLWVERLGQPMAACGTMLPAQAESFMATVAAALRTTLTRENPILEGELPLDGSRFEGLIPPIVPAPAFAIRRKASRVYTLEDYVAAGTMTERQAAAVGDAVAAHENVLVVGGTGSGKTTLTNALIEHITRVSPDDRVVLIEDTAELQCRAENYLPLRATAHTDMLALLRVTMRVRPTRIIVGEVRGAEVLSLLKAWNTGHPGGVATVHANSARAGLLRLESLAAEATPAAMQRTIAAAVNVLVGIEKTTAGRRVREVLRVHGHDGRDYLTTPIED